MGTVLFLVSGTLCLLLWQLFFSPDPGLSKIILETSLDLSDQEILLLGGLAKGQGTLSVDVDKIRSRYESSLLIRRAYVEKQGPGTVRIVLYGRSPLGQIFIPGTFSPLVFDEYGVVYQEAKALACLNLPVLSGVEVENGKLPEPLLPLLWDLKNLQEGAPLLFDQISEICVKGLEGTLNEIALFVESYKLPVILGGSLSGELMKKILLVLDSLESGDLLKRFEYADFRAQKVVLKKREGV